jgi:hypothetical protein
MSLADAYAASIGGSFDQFDHLRGWMNNLITELENLGGEDTVEMIDAHIGPDGIHVTDTREELIDRLRLAVDQLDEIRLLVQTTVAAMP